MASGVEVAQILTKLGTTVADVKALLTHYEDETIPTYDLINTMLSGKDRNVVLLILASVVGKFAETMLEDKQTESLDGPIDMVSGLAKARLYFLTEAKVHGVIKKAMKKGPLKK